MCNAWNSPKDTFRRTARISGIRPIGGSHYDRKPKRYVALDTHKLYVIVGAVNAAQEVVLPARKVSMSEFEVWTKKHLRPTDAVVLEATGNAWYFYDLLEALVARVVAGTSCRPKSLTVTLIPSKSPAFSSPGVANLGSKRPWA